jgi:hypothetical protein
MIEAWRIQPKPIKPVQKISISLGPRLHQQLVSALAQHAEGAFDHFGGSAARAPEKGRIDVPKGLKSAQNSRQRSL